jgi:hypothetical protein
MALLLSDTLPRWVRIAATHKLRSTATVSLRMDKALAEFASQWPSWCFSTFALIP